MQTPGDPLAQLRDIHLPAPPTWWPPATGWWLLGLVALVALGLGIYALLKRRRRNRPVRVARRLLDGLYREYRQGAVSAVAFAHQSNEVLKRLLVHVLDNREATAASGASWLALLDRYSGTDEFTRGPGKVLGADRFQPAPSVDVPALHALLERLLQKVSA